MVDKTERKCYFCEDKIENEEHFLINCPLYSPLRLVLEKVCFEHCNRYKDLNEEQKFIFLMSNENEKVIKALGKFISDSLIVRDRIVTYFFSWKSLLFCCYLILLGLYILFYFRISDFVFAFCLRLCNCYYSVNE